MNLFPYSPVLHPPTVKKKKNRTCEFFGNKWFLNHSIMVLFYSPSIDTGHGLLGGDWLGFLDRAKQDPAQLLINSSCRLLSSQFLPGRQPRRVQSKPATLLPHFAFACQVCSVSGRKKSQDRTRERAQSPSCGLKEKISLPV